MSEVACPLCGTEFDPSSDRSCESCPMAGSCTLTCCPRCGYTTVDVSRSRWARGLDSLLNAPRKLKQKAPDSVLSLGPGESAQVASFADGLTHEQITQLRAYGLDVGRRVRIVQHRPVTVLGVDHTEVALDSDVAAGILVRASASDEAGDP